MADDRYDNHRYHNEDTFTIQSTAGAIPVRNSKGQISMQKVKVQRYVSGKRPDYARRGRSTSESSVEEDDDDFTRQRRSERRRAGYSEDEEDKGFIRELSPGEPTLPEDPKDPRIRRLLAARPGRKSRQRSDESEDENDDEDRLTRHRRIHEPEVLSDGADSGGQRDMDTDDSSSNEDDELDEEAIQRRRDLMRQRALAKAQIGIEEEEIMDKEEEKSASESEEEETTEEETTDSEGDEGARLKPVFVRKKDRLTVQEREKEEAKARLAEREAAMAAEHRRKNTLKLVETLVKQDVIERKAKDNDPQGLNEVATDDENEELEYEAWKLRELKRVKRDREEKDTRERDAAELERMRNLTEDERRQELKSNPKVITNKASKGKYKFMQKYYHRGAFFMEEEEGVYKRDYSEATLEDKFDKTVLPKVMQVKNFGRSGRTKYTHLVDQDTTSFDAPWAQESTQNVKFQLQHAGGMKPVFERPSTKKKDKH
eukprot:maker-scaffold11_size778918-snap-gene-6.56 protein:Tk03691 transcript:maker-scaffold11_size778918-snap-gene-6.56-mRNA-1 annotation:"microfibrillar-associated protein 1"